MTDLEYRRQPRVTNLLNALWSFCATLYRSVVPMREGGGGGQGEGD